MDRRRFMTRSILGVSALSLSASQLIAASDKSRPSNVVTAAEVNQHLRDIGSQWIDGNKSVDTFKAGNPETIVRGMAVGWMSYTSALQKATELGCNLFVTHEPTYYDHFDRDSSVFDFDSAQGKKDFSEESGRASSLAVVSG